MAQHTFQTIFDKVARSLLKQGHPAFDDEREICLYRDLRPEGGRCGIGQIMWNRYYQLSFDEAGLTVKDAKVFEAVQRSLGSGPWDENEREAKIFLRDLQICHDEPAQDGYRGKKWLAKWRREMRLVARRYKLDATALANL